MARVFTFFWVRLSDKSTVRDIYNYICKYPVPLQLEGTGTQYIFAVDKRYSDTVILKMKQDGHNVSRADDVDVTFTDDDILTYEVVMQYKEPTYFLRKISSD